MIDSVFNVPGTGRVVAGTVMGAPIRVGDTMMLGPDGTGAFQPVVVRSIHVHYTPTDVAWPGRSAAFAVRLKGRAASKAGKGKKSSDFVRKGMFMVSPKSNPRSYYDLSCDVVILHHQTTLKVGYAPTLHIGVVHQVAKVVEMTKVDGTPLETLRTGDRAVLKLRFQYRPEFVKPGALMLLRDGRAKGVGRVRSVGPG